MTESESPTAIGVRVAGPDDANTLARLLYDFNTEFATPTPETAVLADRLRTLLAGSSTVALIAESAGSPIGCGLITLRPNVWYDGPVALLDELYVEPAQRSRGAGKLLLDLMTRVLIGRGVELVEINVDDGDIDAQRFYLREGFTAVDEVTQERAGYWYRELPI